MRKSFLVLAVSVCLGLTGCASGGLISWTGEPISQSEGELKYGQLPTDYQMTVMNQISASLIDPMSALYQFEGEPTTKENGWHGRVWVNSKNRMGGYVGRQPYGYMFHNGLLIMLIQPNGMAVRILH
jgi:hypothetical protein